MGDLRAGFDPNAKSRQTMDQGVEAEPKIERDRKDKEALLKKCLSVEFKDQFECQPEQLFDIGATWTSKKPYYTYGPRCRENESQVSSSDSDLPDFPDAEPRARDDVHNVCTQQENGVKICTGVIREEDGTFSYFGGIEL